MPAAPMEVCSNCRGVIGDAEQAHAGVGGVLCTACAAKIRPFLGYEGSKDRPSRLGRFIFGSVAVLIFVVAASLVGVYRDYARSANLKIEQQRAAKVQNEQWLITKKRLSGEPLSPVEKETERIWAEAEAKKKANGE